jgi:hypothetical protein
LVKKKNKNSKVRSKTVIAVASREANLVRRLRRHLKTLGFHKNEEGQLATTGSGKDVIRTLHQSQRVARLRANKDFIKKALPEATKHFANGADIDPALIKPVLKRVESGTWEGDLFRLAALTWAVPVSNGFGRRMRYLVWDDHHKKLIGLIAIGDPVFNLSVRDRMIGWNAKERGDRLVNIMDAYVLGAIPPYNMLLGGKLVASLVRSRDIYDDFTRTYGGSTGIISKKEKKARLLAVTTSSSLGRSSVYNRLKLGKTQYLKSIGYTGGWGHFHIPDHLFSDLRVYLRKIGHSYADHHRFGEGPNWRLRTTRTALSALGFKDDMLRHGIQREVFFCPMASNAIKILKKGKGRPNLKTLLDAEKVAELAVARWMVPRAERRPEYKYWKVDDLKALLKEPKNGSSSVIKFKGLAGDRQK